VFRAADAPGTVLAGPAIIRHAGSTIRVHANQTARIGRNGHVAITLPGGRG
jgi:N-methylhydantoinase A/oxoprolinase/acetone carboxylase beta subunit